MRVKRSLFAYDSLVQLNSVVADHVIYLANEAIEKREVFRIALAGGSTPKGLYGVLAGDKYDHKTDWSAWDIYFSDERIVLPDDHLSNFAMAHSALISKRALKEANIHVVPTYLSSARQIALEYESEILRSFTVNHSGSAPEFDLILLGLGSDGHTASLFPEKSALKATDRLVIESNPGVLPPFVDRVTFTVPLINAAKHVLYMVSGADKRIAFQSAYFGLAIDGVVAPAHLIQPVSGTLEWFITKDLTKE